MDSYVKLRSLTERREQNLGETFQRMAEYLGKTGEHALLQIRILSGDKHLYWCLELDEHGTKVRAEKVDHPDFEIVTRAETWWQIAEGSLSPLEAFTPIYRPSPAVPLSTVFCEKCIIGPLQIAPHFLI